MDEQTTDDDGGWQPTRRGILKAASVLAGGNAVGGVAQAATSPSNPQADGEVGPRAPQQLSLTLTVNGQRRTVQVDSRTTLLDALREHLGLTGTKKGCDHGQCGACTVLLDGRRINACLTLAAMHDGQEVTTIEGLAHGDQLHPLQQAFLDHDGFQCGYCTPGQICSAAAMLAEAKAGMPSHVTADLQKTARLSPEEVRERMSGNICRCSAYPNIVAAILDASGKIA